MSQQIRSTLEATAIPTFHVRDTGGDDPALLSFADFDVTAEDHAAPVERAEAHIRAWADFIERGAPEPVLGLDPRANAVPGRWRYELREVARPALRTQTAHGGAPRVGNPIIVLVSGTEAGRLVQTEERHQTAGSLIGYPEPEQSFRFDAVAGSLLAALEGRTWLCTLACRDALAAMRELLEQHPADVDAS